MRIAKISGSPHPSASNPPDVTRLERRLPPVLSAIAGMVDVIGFLSLGLFTAHVTGNIVLIAALLVRGGPPSVPQVLAVPVFILAVAGAWLVARASDRRGAALVKPLLLVHFLLLVCVLIFTVVYGAAVRPHSFPAGIAAMIAVSAMACQFALLRLAIPGAPSTAVMTGNLTHTVLSLLDVVSGDQPLLEGARKRFRNTLKLLAGFFAGCVIGAAGVSWIGDWAWLLPAALAGAATILPWESSVPSPRTVDLIHKSV